MNWTKAMLDAVKGNERPHGLAQNIPIACDGGTLSVACLIEEASAEGAPIELYRVVGDWTVYDDPHWERSTVYRVSPSWEPAPAKPPEPVGDRCCQPCCPFRLRVSP